MSRVATDGSVSGSKLVTQNMLLGLDKGWMTGRGTEEEKIDNTRWSKHWCHFYKKDFINNGKGLRNGSSCHINTFSFLKLLPCKGCWCETVPLYPVTVSQSRFNSGGWRSPSLGFTKPLVTPRLWAETASPFTTRCSVNSEDRVCMTMGRSRSRTCSTERRETPVYMDVHRRSDL